MGGRDALNFYVAKRFLEAVREGYQSALNLPDCSPASSNAQYRLESIGVAAVGDDLVARAVTAKRGHPAHQDLGFDERTIALYGV